MHGRSTLDDEPMAEMNMIPMIDIALTLVIILMVTSAFVRQPGFSLKLPETTTREGSPENRKDVVISVASDGSLYLDGRRRPSSEIDAHLRRAAAANKETRVLVKGDRSVVYSRVMEVMDLVRQAGLKRVVLPTEPRPPATIDRR